MATGEQAEIGGLRVDRPIWLSTPARHRNRVDRDRVDPRRAPRPATTSRRLPRFELYVPPVADPPSRGRVDVDLSGPFGGDLAGPVVSRSLPTTAVGVDIAPPGTRERRIVRPVSPVVRPHVDIDLTAPESWRSDPVEPGTSGLAQTRRAPPRTALRRSDEESDHHERPLTSSATGSAAGWARRRVRHVRRRLRRPHTTLDLDRTTILLCSFAALLVVGAAAAVGARAKVADQAGFVAVAGSLHQDPEVAADLAERVTAALDPSRWTPSEHDAATTAVTAMIIDPAFGPTWERALERAHREATGGVTADDTSVGELFPGLPAHLEAEGIGTAAGIADRPVVVLRGQYVSQLGSSIGWIDRAATVLPLGALAAIAVVLVRSPNRSRAASLAAVLAAGGASIAFIAVSVVGGPLVGVMVADQVRPLAVAAVDGVLPTVRICLVGVVLIGGLLGLAGRVQESWSAPPFRMAARVRRPRRGVPRSRPFPLARPSSASRGDPAREG